MWKFHLGSDLRPFGGGCSSARVVDCTRVGNREVPRPRLLFMGALDVRSKPIVEESRG